MDKSLSDLLDYCKYNKRVCPKSVYWHSVWCVLPTTEKGEKPPPIPVILVESLETSEICELNGTVAHVAVDGLYAGYILIGDTLKPEASKAISDLRLYGVEKVVMLTGDNQCAAESVAKHLGMDAFHAGLLPEDKVRLLEEIKAGTNHGGKIAFVGDGINDAPVIARADVGVAMGALGSDAAIETADVVLMTDSPLKMAIAVKVAKETRKIVWENIVMALSVKGLFIVLGAFGVASMWEAVFADMGVALAATANATRALGAGRPAS